MKKSESLAQAPSAVFRIWNYRKTIELEAAALFGHLGSELMALRGSTDPVALLAQEASADELKHADYCHAILKLSAELLESREPRQHLGLGPSCLSRAQKVLYTCVAMGCVTETLSTALLTAMQKRAAPGLIRETVHQILSDEVNHSRIGWVELARVAKFQDITWLSAYVPGMIQDALSSDVAPMLGRAEVDLSEWGILMPVETKTLMAEAISEVVIPGLRYNGIVVSEPVSNLMKTGPLDCGNDAHGSD